MARTDSLTNFLTDVSAAIKQKTGDNTPIVAADFDTEILSIETVGDYQIKSVSITSNGDYQYQPDQSYDAISQLNVSVNVPLENLNAELNAQDQKLEALEQLLLTKAAGGGDGSSMNIFIQTTEPVVKKGIWLNTSNETIEHVIASDNVITTSGWLPTGTKTDVPDAFSDRGAVSYIGTDIYLFCGNSDNTNYKYNTLTDTYTQIANFPFLFSLAPAFVPIGTDIYAISGMTRDWDSMRTIYKYDTINDTFVQIDTTLPFPITICKAAAVGTDIYIFGTDYSLSDGIMYSYKYNTLTNTYTKMANAPYNFSYGSCIAVGTDIYMFGGQDDDTMPVTTAYKYSTSTDTYTQLTDTPYAFWNGYTALISDDIYMIGMFNDHSRDGYYVYKYNISTDTYAQVATIPEDYRPANYENIVGNIIAAIGNDIYLYGAYSEIIHEWTAVNVYQVQSEFADNSVVLLNGNTYKTQLFSNSEVDDSVKYNFADVWFYTTQGGLDTTIPTYYGDGTQWVNIKNPPVSPIEETVEEEE
jgi:N-acetylneuraminic acid mutarotase